VLIRFTAWDICAPTTSQGGLPCFVRALVNGAAAPPGEVMFDRGLSSEGGNDATGAHAMDWSSGKLSPGTYSVQIQAHTSSFNPGPTGPWHLTVMRVII